MSIFIFLSVYAHAQKIEFDRLLDKDGLVNSSINSILKDSYGYMWIGTFNGLSKYDGYSFINYLNQPKNSNSIPDNYVSFIAESADSTLYIGLQYAGFCIYNRKSDSFIRFRHDPLDSNSISDDNVMVIFPDSKGNIWIGNRSGIDKFNPKTGTCNRFRPDEKENFFVSSIAEDKNGNLWLYGRGDHIAKFNLDNHSFELIKYGNQSVNNVSFNKSGTLMLDRKDNLWISSPGVGLFRYNITDQKKESFLEEDGKILSKIISSIMEDSEGIIWIATDGAGIYRYNYKNNSFNVLQNSPLEPTSLSTNAVYYVYESEPGMIWIGTYASGLNIYKKHKNKFKKYTVSGSPGKCLSQKSVLCIKEADDGKIWIGTDGGGINVYKPETDSFVYYNTGNSNIHSDIITSICIDSMKNFWLGSYGSSLCRTNFENGSFKIYTGNLQAKGETIKNQHVWYITESFDKKIWIGLLDYGINVYNPERNNFTYFEFDKEAFSKAKSNIFKLFEDTKKRMWVATETVGAGYYDPLSMTFKRYIHNPDNPNGISSNDIRDVFEDSQGTIWIATYKGGLNKLVDSEKGIFKIYNVESGLPTNNIQGILEDDHHNLWLSTDKGITLFNVKENIIQNFDTEDGLQSNTFNYHAQIKDKNGNMYFGGINGLNIFHPDSIFFNHTIPPVTLTDFKVFNKSVLPGQQYNEKIYLNESIETAREITLTHEDYVFSLEFASLDMTAPGKNKYAYRLHGFDEDWTYVSADKRIAIYTNLNPGKYIFQVIASNNDGVWNNEGASLKINILPPWWLTWWFKTIMTTMFIMIIVGINYIRVRNIKAKNVELEKEVKKRTAELKEANEFLNQRKVELENLNRTKDKFFSIISHDLKGPIKALIALTTFLQDEAKNDVGLNRLAEHINLSSHKIQNLVLSLLEWARTQTGSVKTDATLIEVEKLFNENVALLSNQAMEKKIDISMEIPIGITIFADYNMVTTIIRNILSNSIKYTPNGGKIILAASSAKDNKVKLSIADNGIGMSGEILMKLFTLEQGPSVKGTANEVGTGLGMIIAKEFAELNKAQIYAESEEGKGSTFYIVLPANNKN